jgi:ribonuclease HII
MLEIHKNQKHMIVAGLDEAGRGCLSGPVVCASVILPNDYYNNDINDSKKLSKAKRDKIYSDIINNAVSYSIQEIDNNKIDEINILQATLLGWTNCINTLDLGPDFLIIDGNRFIKDYSIPHECVVSGDAKYLSIAAASILAKVKKDEVMAQLHEEYPMYNWIKNSGYGTKEHKSAIEKYGLSPYHRHSYKLK